MLNRVESENLADCVLCMRSGKEDSLVTVQLRLGPAYAGLYLYS